MQSLNQLKSLAREHWKKFQPTLYKKLRKSGKLEKTLREAAEWTYKAMKDEVVRRVKDGEGRLNAEQLARELFLEERILLPDENEEKGSNEAFPHSELLRDLDDLRKSISDL